MTRIFLVGALLLLGLTSASAQTKQPVQIKFTDKNQRAWDFMIGDQLVTTYDFGNHYAAGKPSFDGSPNGPHWSKPMFFPVYAPGQVPLTRSWPMQPAKPGEATDHPHQQSAWFCHGDVVPEGMELKSKIKNIAGVDFWSIAKGHGVITCSDPGTPKNGEGHAYVTTKNEWRTAEGEKIMDETRTIHLYALDKARLIVVDIDLHASVCPITFADTKEGAFGIRINDVINAGKTGKGKIQNAEGKVGEKECWGQYSAWCDYSGPVDGKQVGLAVLADPKNPYASAWHVRGYGLMAANPLGRDKHAKFPAVKGNNELVRLKKGEHLRFRYGMVLHTGDAVSGDVAAAYQRFVELRAKE